jgi:hypothetical protein
MMVSAICNLLNVAEICGNGNGGQPTKNRRSIRLLPPS